ncbi:MAG: DUF4397 domain-containing protein [Gemmatimonas sp.]
MYAHISRRFSSALLTMAILVTACGDDTADPYGSEAGSLQVINASTSAVDVRVDGTVKFTGIAVGSLSPILALPAGQHAVQLTPAGASAGGATVTVSIASDSRRTIAATRAAAGVNAMAFADTGLLVGVGRSKLRVLHLASNAPPLDIWRTQPDFQTPISILFPYAYLSGATVESSSGTWEVRVWPTGAGNWGSAAGALTVPIGSGQLRTVVTLDVAGGGVKLQLLEP